jgi:large subunit ribosomal protein L32e
MIMENKTLVKIRIRQKRKKPEFLRQEYYTHPHKLGRKWRQPMGRTSKMRYKEKSRGKQPSVGYGSPASLRGFSRFGFRLVRVANVPDISKITDPKKEMIEIAGGVGNKKKAEIIKAAREKNILIFNRPGKSIEKKKKIVKSVKKEEPKKPAKPAPKKEEHKQEKPAASAAKQEKPAASDRPAASAVVPAAKQEKPDVSEAKHDSHEHQHVHGGEEHHHPEQKPEGHEHKS